MSSAKKAISTKRLAIDKANTQTVIIVAVAAFVSIFSLVAAHAILGQNQYQARVISAKQKAHTQLVTNLQTASQLATAYKAFNNASPNIINGNPSGSGQNDGNNSKLILDALPSSYDFPALTASLEALLTNDHLTISSISGTDDQLNQQANVSSSKPQPVPIPFSFAVSNANYAAVQNLVASLQNAIRPIQIDSMTIAGGGSDMTVAISAHSYYQPAKNLSITKETIK